MGRIAVPDASDVPRNVDTFTRQEGGEEVHNQAVAVVNPLTGNPLMPGSDGALPLSPGASTEATVAAILAKLISAPATEATLAAILAKLSANPATAAHQLDGNALLNAIGTAMATASGQSAGNASLSSIDGKVATQTTLAAVLAKLIANPATDTLQSAGNASLSSIDGKVATQTTLAAVLAKLIANPATDTLQSAGNASLSSIDSKVATQTTLASIDADLGNVADVEASSDVGSFSLISLFKRGLQRLTTMLGRLPTLLTTVPANDVAAPPVRLVGQDIWTCSFAGSGASVLSSDLAQPPVVGTGVGYSQANGNLLITTGTTANAEFLARSVVSWRGAMRLRASIVASQRIANQNLAVMLADLLGESLAFTINSATSVTVNMAGHAFTAQNVGQFVNLAGISGAAGVPGRYAIASVVAGVSITFTVAGWPASGSGTLTLMGWNYVRNLFTGTTATNVAWDAQRNGWASGDSTATINTTASPGTIIQNDVNGRDAFLMDALRASSTTPNFVTRGSRYENLPDDNVQLYLWVWSFNGTAAPASTTTWTLGFLSVEKFASNPVYLQGARANGSANALPVAVQNSLTFSANTPTLAAGTNLAGDVGQQYRASATGASGGAHIVSAAGTNATIVKASAGKVLGWNLANNTASWRYVKLHNQTTAPTAGSGVVRTIAIPPNGSRELVLEGGVAFATGIGMTITGGAADNDTTAVAANDVVGDLFFA